MSSRGDKVFNDGCLIVPVDYGDSELNVMMPGDLILAMAKHVHGFPLSFDSCANPHI